MFDPRYPYSPERQYTPVSALYDELLDFNSNLSVTDLPGNIVLVQPSPYGSDNSLILDLLRNHSLSQQSNLLRAIAVIDPETVTDEELHEMNALGVRGIRINTQAANSTETAEELRRNITAAVERVKGFNNWKCQLYISGDSWDCELSPADQRCILLTRALQISMILSVISPSRSLQITRAAWEASQSLRMGAQT